MNQKKPSLIFIHGFRGGPSGVIGIADHFSDYQVFTPALPPFGKKNTLESYDLEHYTEFLSNYITKNKISQPVLVGHSMGSIIVASVADKHPELVNDKLILLSPISHRVIKPIARLGRLITILPRESISRLTTWYLFAANRHKNPELYQKALSLTEESAKEYYDKKALADSAVFSSSYSIREFNLDNKQVCLIAGSRDRIVSKNATKKLAKILSAKAHFIPNSGHLINYENSDKVAKLIRRFLEQ